VWTDLALDRSIAADAMLATGSEHPELPLAIRAAEVNGSSGTTPEG